MDAVTVPVAASIAVPVASAAPASTVDQRA